MNEKLRGLERKKQLGRVKWFDGEFWLRFHWQFSKMNLQLYRIFGKIIDVSPKNLGELGTWKTRNGKASSKREQLEGENGLGKATSNSTFLVGFFKLPVVQFCDEHVYGGVNVEHQHAMFRCNSSQPEHGTRYKCCSDPDRQQSIGQGEHHCKGWAYVFFGQVASTKACAIHGPGATRWADWLCCLWRAHYEDC